MQLFYTLEIITVRLICDLCFAIHLTVLLMGSKKASRVILIGWSWT